MRKLMKPKVLCAACLSTALVSGLCIYRAVFRGVDRPELALSIIDPVGAANPSSSAAMREVAGVENATAAAAGASSTPSNNSRIGEDEGLRAAVPPPPTGSVMENARSVFAEMSSEILAKWGPEYEDTLFSGGMAFSDGGRVVEDKIIRAVVKQGDFLAAFTGNSITAGHDCLFEESYPVLLNATMSRLMATAGVRFEAINVAMGNSRSSPYSFCVDAHAGIDADIISWGMGMEVTGAACGPAAQAVELFVRSATVLPRRPAVLVIDPMPDQDMCDEHRLNLVSRRNNRFMGHCGTEPEPEKNLMQVYREFGLHQFFPSTLVPTYTCGDERFARSLLYGTGKHYPRPRRWHPAPAGHALVADMLFMHYAKVFVNALDRLEEAAPTWTVTQFLELSTPSRDSLGVSLGLWGDEGDSAQASTGTVSAGDDRDSGSFMAGGRGSVLPRPVWCKGWSSCEGAGNYRCANTYFPLAGKNGSRLVDMVSERTPVVNSGHESILMPPSRGHWAVTLNEFKVPLLEYLKTTPPEGMHRPIDMKWVLVGDAESGSIEFEFETIGVVPVGAGVAGGGAASTAVEIESNVNSTAAGVPRVTVAEEEPPRVVVCRPDFIDRVELDDKAGVRYSVDGVETSPVELVTQYGLTKGSCVLLAAEIGAGRHTLTVEPLKTGKPFVAISHVLYPA